MPNKIRTRKKKSPLQPGNKVWARLASVLHSWRRLSASAQDDLAHGGRVHCTHTTPPQHLSGIQAQDGDDPQRVTFPPVPQFRGDCDRKNHLCFMKETAKHPLCPVLSGGSWESWVRGDPRQFRGKKDKEEGMLL